MRIAVLNGPNLNLLGRREPEVYGRTTFAELEAMVRDEAERLGVHLEWFQSNHEGALVDRIQALAGTADGLVLNAAAYTHTSIAIRDALLAVSLPFIEVHLSDPRSREPFRHHSFTADLALQVIAGKGVEGYRQAVRALHEHLAGR
jgi:3-dehydroquinate dehydratase-2